MSNKNLFKEAIADAKAVREAALANAKAALEEALTPKLQSMLAEKMKEYEEYEELEEGDDEMEEGFLSSHGTDDNDENLDFNLEETEELEEDFDLSEILAELGDDNLEEGKKEDKEEDKKKKKKMMKEAEDEDEEESEEEETEEVADMTIDDLKALIADIVAQEMGEKDSEESKEDMSMGMGDEEGDEEEEINLEELLAELDSLEEKKEDKIDEIVSITPSWLSAKVYGLSQDDIKACRQSSKSRSAYLDCVEKKGGAFQSSGTDEEEVSGFGQSGISVVGSKKRKKEGLEEAIKVINTLRSELNEVNLLNAKLLYVNKIFKAKNLSESQKLQVIASFDKATTAKEAKVVYESLNATLTTTAPKKQIKESLGFASKAAGVAPKSVIVESNDVITRMQKLANIIK